MVDFRAAIALSFSLPPLSMFLLLHVEAIFHEQTSRLWKTLTRVILRTAPRGGRLDLYVGSGGGRIFPRVSAREYGFEHFLSRRFLVQK